MKRILAILTLLLCAFGCSSLSSQEPVVVLDMRSYNDIDRQDEGQIMELWDAFHAISSVQGIVNRDKPRLYVKYVYYGEDDIDSYWWDKYREPGEWLSRKKVCDASEPLEVIEHFRGFVDGLVVWDPSVVSTSNVASTVAGADNLIAVRYDPRPGSMYSKLRDMGFEVKVWLINEDGTSRFGSKLAPYRWAVDNYLKAGKCNTKYAAYYIDGYWMYHNTLASLDHHCLTNHDFFIGNKAFFFDLSPWGDEVATDALAYPFDPSPQAGADLELMKEILHEIYVRNGNGDSFCHIGGFPAWAFKYTNFGSVGGKHEPVATEWEFARIISAYNAYKDADAISLGAMANASFWKSFPLERRYPQDWVTLRELREKGYVREDGTVCADKKYAIFYVGDYDAASWLYKVIPSLWDAPDRGKVPMMWSISPALAVRAPMAMDYMRRTASAMDYFVAADNGAGYLNPGILAEPREISSLPSGLDQWAAHCKPMYEQWGLSITGFVIDGFAPPMDDACFECYRKFSPDGIVPQKIEESAMLFDDMPVLRSGPDINSGDYEEAALDVASYLGNHPDMPFYWYRAILKSPTWYLQVQSRVSERYPDVEWVDAPTFFALLRMFLSQKENQ